jgi:outer membrane receptor protein involved in Fe transport
VAKKVKKPKFDELYAGIKSGDGSSGDPFETGNQNLIAEKSLGYELGVEKFFDNNSGLFAINGYYRKIEDKVESQTILKGDGNYYKTKINIGEAKLYGVEFDTKKDLDEIIDGLSVYGNLSFMRGTWMDEGVKRDLKDVPKYALNIGFDQTIPQYDLTIGAAFNRLDGFEAYESATKEKIETSRNIFDVYALKQLNKTLNLRISAKNITEVEKHKKDTEFYDSGRVKKVNHETEYSEVMFFVALEGKF